MKYNLLAILVIVIGMLGMLGLHFKIDYSGWIVFVGVLAIFDCDWKERKK